MGERNPLTAATNYKRIAERLRERGYKRCPYLHTLREEVGKMQDSVLSAWLEEELGDGIDVVFSVDFNLVNKN